MVWLDAQALKTANTLGARFPNFQVRSGSNFGQTLVAVQTFKCVGQTFKCVVVQTWYRLW